MAILDDLMNHFQQVVDHLDEAVGAATAADQSASEAHSNYENLGDQRASMAASLKEGTDSLRAQLQGCIDHANELIQHTEAIRSGGV